MHIFTHRKNWQMSPQFLYDTHFHFYKFHFPYSLQHLLISDIHFSNYDKAVCLFCIYWPFSFHPFSFILLSIVLLASWLRICKGTEEEFGEFWKWSKPLPFSVVAAALLARQWGPAFSVVFAWRVCSCRFPPVQTVRKWRRAVERLDSTVTMKRKDKGNQSSVGGLCASFVKDSAKVSSGWVRSQLTLEVRKWRKW